MDVSGNSENSEEAQTTIDESSKDGNETKATKDELDSILDDALGDFDKYQSSSVDPVDKEAPQSKPEAEQEIGQVNPELPPLPADQEAFFNAVFNNPEAQQMFSGMNDAFAGLMTGFEQISQDPELKNEMDQMMQNMMGGGAAASEPPRTAFPSPPPTTTPSIRTNHRRGFIDSSCFNHTYVVKYENSSLAAVLALYLVLFYPSLSLRQLSVFASIHSGWRRTRASSLRVIMRGTASSKVPCIEYVNSMKKKVIQIHHSQKKDRIMKIMNLIQEMESYGEPPKEIVGDMPSTGLQFDERGLPKIPGMPSGDQCNIM
ncbi:putative peroxisomal biogenesis factor 19-like [Apostichopus japonicus]|uniref:Peroxin-19 n=1 Tax=Stichopus japonicus TaxID=307972 RepID=A0A2G8LL75_STIJA|nr:putative peroxisomal biogenesis factor 19-like [Apostichopus japonicus]